MRGKETCDVTMSWTPVVAGNVQNNFIVSWHESNVSQNSAKAEKVPVYGNAVNKEDCNFCETVPGASGSGTAAAPTAKKMQRAIVGPGGAVIGYADEDGYIYDENGNVVDVRSVRRRDEMLCAASVCRQRTKENVPI